MILESIRRRPLPAGDPTQSSAELEGLRDAIEGVVTRLEGLEEERDFYKELLESPGIRRELSPPADEEDPHAGPA